MKKTVMVMAALCFSLLALSPVWGAEEGRYELKNSATMKEVLTERMGKQATIRLHSGEELDGTVTMVGQSLVHLAKLRGKDFYDAVINIDKISAVLIKVRSR